MLETFPQLQGRLSATHSLTQPRSNLAYPSPPSTARTSTSTLRDDLSPHATSRTIAPTTGVVQRTDNVSDDIGSWSGSGTLPRTSGGQAGGGTGGKKVRKSPEGSHIADSGFSTETKDPVSTSTTGTLMSPGSKMVVPPQLDVRWDTWEDGVPQQQQHEDELMHLLDVIHRKTVRLKRDVDTKVKLMMQLLVMR